MGALMLLDTATLYHRAFYGLPETVVAPDGTPVNAVRGLLDAMSRLVRARRPSGLVACLDEDWRPAFRVAAIGSYKAHRADADGAELTPPTLAAQVPVIREVLAAIGVATVGAAGYEADDVIATLAARAAGRGRPVEVVTGDRDLFQLVDDAREVRVVYIARGLASPEVVDEAVVSARYDIPGRAYADYAVLRGDPSDGLPGVPGVGPKTAAAVIRTFGGIKAITAALDAGHGGFPTGSRKKLAAARAYLDVAPAVVRTATDVPLPDVPSDLPVPAPERLRLRELGERWGLGSSLTRCVTAVTATAGTPPPQRTAG